MSAERWDWWYWRMLEVEDLSAMARAVGHPIGLDVSEFGESRDSVRRLAERTGWSVSSVRRGLRELESAGLIWSESRARGVVARGFYTEGGFL